MKRIKLLADVNYCRELMDVHGFRNLISSRNYMRKEMQQTRKQWKREVAVVELRTRFIEKGASNDMTRFLQQSRWTANAIDDESPWKAF